MIEVLVAMVVFAVGLISLGSLAAKTLNGTESSRFAGLAANLASAENGGRSESLACLAISGSAYAADPQRLCGSPASTSGSLTADTSANVTSNGITENVNYYDDVEIADGSGSDFGDDVR